MKASVTWVIATRNDHKVGEIRAILGPAFEYRTLRDFPGVPAVREDAPDFAGNAVKKATEIAQFVAQHAGKLAGHSEPWVMADDSGLEVDALNGAPGVHSARFAATDPTSGNSPDAANNEKLLKLLREVPMERRTARFRCVIAVTPVVFERRKEVFVMPQKRSCAPSFLKANAKDESRSNLPVAEVLAMILCSFRMDLANRSRSWAKRSRTGLATARKLWNSSEPGSSG